MTEEQAERLIEAVKTLAGNVILVFYALAGLIGVLFPK